MTTIIAIAGGSGAGKSAVARALAPLIGASAALIHEDDYYHCRTRFPAFDPATHNFDLPAAKDHALLIQHLAAARAGRGFEKPLYDFTTHSRRAETEWIAPARALILEGTHVLASAPLRAQIDFSVFIDMDESLRLARRLARDTVERGRSAESVRAQFAQTVQPAHAQSVAPQQAFADLTLSAGEDGEMLESARLAGLIAARLTLP
ncbi:MAG: uridine kinase [Hyphomonadaceae bacterium]